MQALLPVVLLLAGCVSNITPKAAAIVETDEKGVANCEFAGLVSGSSLLGGAVQERARENAKTHALNEAAGKGATHIVWTDVSSTKTQGASAQGRAYKCP